MFLMKNFFFYYPERINIETVVLFVVNNQSMKMLYKQKNNFLITNYETRKERTLKQTKLISIYRWQILQWVDDLTYWFRTSRQTSQFP